MIAPVASYQYDAIYQLKKANGREHIGQNQMPDDNWNDTNFTKLVHKGDGNAMRAYIQTFLYDEVGNIKQLAHTANGGSYTRDYEYEALNNQLKNTKIGATTFTYMHDAHGNIDSMPHLALMEWDFKDQLKATQQTVANNGNGEKTYYVYDGSGQRIRKITEWQGTTNKKEERIYLGGFEIYRSYKMDGSTIEIERETLHIMDDKRRVALVETKTKDNESNDATVLNISLTRYQHDNHLGSANLELDDNAAIVSYEEYHPYGTTAYQATDKNINSVAKRYRYTGMERDEESGFEYHSARYYLPWLGRWINADRISIHAGINLFRYVLNNPICFMDTTGEIPKKPPSAAGVFFRKVAKSIVIILGGLGKDPSGNSKPANIPIVVKDKEIVERDESMRKDIESKNIEEKAIPEPKPKPEPPITPDPPGTPGRVVKGELQSAEKTITEEEMRIGTSIIGGGSRIAGEEPIIEEEMQVGLSRIGTGARIGLGTKTVAVVATAMVVSSSGSVKEKVETLAGVYVTGAGTELIATSVVGAELAGILSLPLGLLIGICSDSPSTCEDRARGEAQQDLLEEINGRAWAIYSSQLGSYPGPEWKFAYAKAVHEKYIELGGDKADAEKQKFLHYCDLSRDLSKPIYYDNNQHMSAP